MSLKKYMAIDLTILCISGMILEGIGTYLSFYAFAGSIASTVFSVLILFMALIRWRYWGLLITPFLALGNFVGVACINIEKYTSFLSFQYYLSNLLGLLACAVIFTIYTKKRIRMIDSSIFSLEGLGLLSIIAFEVIRVAFYILMVGSDKAVITLADILGLVILLLAIFILYCQGSLRNVKCKLLDDKKEKEIEDDFSIQWDDEEKSEDNGDESSPKNE